MRHQRGTLVLAGAANETEGMQRVRTPRIRTPGTALSTPDAARTSMTLALVLGLLSLTFAAVGLAIVAQARRAGPYGRCADRAAPVVAAVAGMTTDELESTITELAARESALRAAGDVEGARRVGFDRFVCMSELRARPASRPVRVDRPEAV
ncbi:hypothetical protein DW322_16735 [Rhodococcus rhodnii]|uniref:Uncharacterized protein n=1 Tax=Rhodococcus rhodnii TaxID=38312 RepID=A0A6P2CG58_9NOCA|nr:hypothetical protein DW322_16735 [Rhodococcus rhodnii]